MYSVFSTDELILVQEKYLPDWVADEDAVEVSGAFDADETVGEYSADRLICLLKFDQFIDCFSCFNPIQTRGSRITSKLFKLGPPNLATFPKIYLGRF